MVTDVALVALLAAFVILLLDKTGIREKGQIYAPKPVSDMLNCDFCISFWTCVLISLVLFIFVDTDYKFLSYPLFACPLTRKML